MHSTKSSAFTQPAKHAPDESKCAGTGKTGTSDSCTVDPSTAAEPGHENPNGCQEAPTHPLDVPLPSILSQTRPPQTPTTVVPHAWAPAWTDAIFDLTILAVNALSVADPKTLRKSAKPRAALARLDKARKEQYGAQLAALRWVYQLTQLNPKLDISSLVDNNAYGPHLLKQAPSWHTLALMVAAGECLEDLYLRLHDRAADPDSAAKMTHMSMDQLPATALLAGSLMFGPRTSQFTALLAKVLGTLRSFGDEAQAQVHADLYALYLMGDDIATDSAKQCLVALGTTASKAQLVKIALLSEVHGTHSSGEPIDPTHVSALLETLPALGEPWNLFALVTMRLLSGMHQKSLLLPGQLLRLIGKATDMLRHFMSLARPGAEVHPLHEATTFLFGVAPAAFMQLAPQEKIRFLQTYPPETASAFIKRLVHDQDLPVFEKIRLGDEILAQAGVSAMIVGALNEWRRALQAPG